MGIGQWYPMQTLWAYKVGASEDGWRVLKPIRAWLAEGGDLRLLTDAVQATAALGWEGDMMEAGVFGLPDGGGGFHVGLVWQQGEDGTVFVISPVVLPYLDMVGESRRFPCFAEAVQSGRALKAVSSVS